MKRIATFALAAIMLLCLFGCGKEALPKEGPVGTTLKSDMVEVTLTEFGFAEEGVSIDEEQPDVFCKPIPFPYKLTGNEAMDNLTLTLSERTYVRATEEKCVVYLEFNVKIISEEIVKQTIMPSVHFNNTDCYNFNALSGELLSDYYGGMANTQRDGIYYCQNGDSWDALEMFWSPDGEYVCRGVAKIPVEVQQNTDAPLTVMFTLPNSDGSNETYTFTIR